MRWWIFLCIFTAALARADWTLGEKNELATLPGGAKFIEREARDGERAVRVTGVFFSEDHVAPAVVDNPTQSGKLDAAAGEAGAFAGVNGGFFHPDWKPAGLAIADGKKTNDFEKAKLLSGVFVVTKGQPRLVRSAEYKASKHDQHALQAGPILVDHGESTIGLNADATARRTAIATDGKGNWALLYLTYVSLADAGRILASSQVFPDFAIDRALNLDGGSSSAIWVATEPRPFYLREIGSVRNYVVLRPR